MDDKAPVTTSALKLPIHDARALLGPEGRAGLMLDGTLYMLRLTQTGKLILTK